MATPIKNAEQAFREEIKTLPEKEQNEWTKFINFCAESNVSYAEPTYNYCEDVEAWRLGISKPQEQKDESSLPSVAPPPLKRTRRPQPPM